MREAQILDQHGEYWLADDAGQYTVYRDGPVIARADSSYPRTPDGLSLARARLAWLAGKGRKAGEGRVRGGVYLVTEAEIAHMQAGARKGLFTRLKGPYDDLMRCWDA